MPEIEPRASWGHPGPLGPAMELPARRLWLHHSVTTASNGPGAVRTVAQIGVERFGRSSYSFACTLDGRLWEMQGNHVGAHTAGQNSTSLAVVLVGNYDVTQITRAQIESVAWLHRHLVDRGWLDAGAPLDGHRDAPGAATACPGRTAYAALPAIRALIANPQEDDMSLNDQDLKRVRDAARRGVADAWENDTGRLANGARKVLASVLNRGTGRGQDDWASTVKAILSTVQGNHNKLLALIATVKGLDPADVDEEAIAQAVIEGLDQDTAARIVARMGELLSARPDGD